MAKTIRHNVLIVNRDSGSTGLVLEVLAAKGIRGKVAVDYPDAFEDIEMRDWDLIVADLDGGDGLSFQLIRRSVQAFPERPVIMLSDGKHADRCVKAMREGCRDVLLKPLTRQDVRSVLEMLLPNHEVPLAAGDIDDRRGGLRIAGVSEALLGTIELARKVSPSTVPVLITGESGVGKELIAWLVHDASRRSSGPYIRVNCAALSESLLESELFGHERGAFTGAHAQRKGRFERADGGTLILDEISETTPRLQAELLRVLEQQDFERLGGSESIRVSVRVISTSNRNLVREVENGRFRADLYYRLRGLQIVVPPLRDRIEDIEILTWHFVNQYARETCRRITGLDPKMLDAFHRYDWPGNVRELRSVVRSALILGEGEVLSLDGLDLFRTNAAPRRRAEGSGTGSLSLREMERSAIFEALRRTKSHQVKAAKLLGITDRTLREKLRRYRSDGYEPCTAGEGRWLIEPA